MWHYFTAFYHPQINGQTERFNKIIIERLRHYASDHQMDRNFYVTYAHNMQVHHSAGSTPLYLILTYNRPVSLFGMYRRILKMPQIVTVAFQRYLLSRVGKFLACAAARSTAAKQSYKKDFGEKVRFRLYTLEMKSSSTGPRRALAANKKNILVNESTKRVSKKLLESLMQSHGSYKVVSVTDSNVIVQLMGSFANCLSIA